MEKNSNTLSEAIARLPQHQPPDRLWMGIAEQLNFDQTLYISLLDMPVYTPSAAVWDNLAAKMEQLPELKPKPKARPMLKWLMVASLLMVASVVVFQTLNPEPTPTQQQTPPPAPELPKNNEPIAQIQPVEKTTLVKTTVGKYPKTKPTRTAPNKQPQWTNRTEVVDDVLLQACQNTDDSGYAMIETLCKEALPVCEEPQFKKLKSELDELTRAHSELKSALGQYADDPALVSQLVQIEQSRNQILQQLITLI